MDMPYPSARNKAAYTFAETAKAVLTYLLERSPMPMDGLDVRLKVENVDHRRVTISLYVSEEFRRAVRLDRFMKLWTKRTSKKLYEYGYPRVGNFDYLGLDIYSCDGEPLVSHLGKF